MKSAQIEKNPTPTFQEAWEPQPWMTGTVGSVLYRKRYTWAVVGKIIYEGPDLYRGFLSGVVGRHVTDVQWGEDLWALAHGYNPNSSEGVHLAWGSE